MGDRLIYNEDWRTARKTRFSNLFMTKAPPGSVSRFTIARNLQLGRTIFNLSQEDLGARCDLHRTHISAIERQELNVGVDTVERIARALSVPAFVLLMPRAEAQVLLYEAYLGTPGRKG